PVSSRAQVGCELVGCRRHDEQGSIRTSTPTPCRREPSYGGPAADAAALVRGGRREVTENGTAGRPSAALRQVLIPLALAQFICSFAGTNMNVMINAWREDRDT